jgi:4-diphosphocytidyl-2-C-methyl-D-erythritol kinase
MASDDAAVLKLAAPAKINFYLEVLGRRSDGYHEIETFMTPLALADELTFTAALELTLTCDDPSLPLDENNLVLKAARLLQHQRPGSSGAHIHLTKRIPTAAGLGGGSSDAATTLRGLNQLWQLDLSDEELIGLAAQLGSDVPFFLYGSSAWCEGRGDWVTATKVECEIPLLLICPVIGLSTAEVYQELHAPPLLRGRPGGIKDTSFHLIPLGKSEHDMREALDQGNVPRIGHALFNRLQPAAEQLLPLVAEIRQLLDELAPENLFWGHQMSGSGSSYFAVCRGQTEAQRLARLISERWAGGVLNTGMGTAESKDGPPERTIRLLVTSGNPLV